MPQTTATNRRLVLAERPRGEPTKDTLRLETAPIPTPGPGQMLLRTEFLSLDPYMRGRMSDAPSYAAPVAIGAVMQGGTVAQVTASRIDAFATGDWVLSFNGWQDYALSDGAGVTALGRDPQYPSWALGILGMPGFTAWAGQTTDDDPHVLSTPHANPTAAGGRTDAQPDPPIHCAQLGDERGQAPQGRGIQI